MDIKHTSVFCMMQWTACKAAILPIKRENTKEKGTCDPYPDTCARLPRTCWSRRPPRPVSWARSAGCPAVWRTRCPGSLCSAQRPAQPSSDPASGGPPPPEDAWKVHHREGGEVHRKSKSMCLSVINESVSIGLYGYNSMRGVLLKGIVQVGLYEVWIHS